MSDTLDASGPEAGSRDRRPDEAGDREGRTRALVHKLGGRSIVLVGMMGAGKTSVGRRLAQRLGLDFVDADHEIEASAGGLTISEIFARYGEAHFRDVERRVISRLLGERQRVLATGGGAYMQQATRERIAATGVSIWLKADADVLLRRVRKRANRPMLNTPDPEETLKRLIAERYPVYAQADLTIVSRDGPHEVVLDAISSDLDEKLDEILRQRTDPARETRVTVELGERRYDIRIGRGLLEQAGAAIRALDPRAACCIVTDENLARWHLPALEASLDAAGVRHARVIIAPGEASKSYEGFAQVCDAALAANIERNDLLIAFGGGVVGDLAGFVASCLRRGMRFVQIPTSVLAQVDSSVGGKTAINAPHGKNLVGAFHQPSLVLADTGMLETLDPREFRAGYAEIAKYGVINDPAFFDWLEQNWRGVFAFGTELTEAIRHSCRAKALVVARDETEQGERALLNFGHTFGHALEALTDFDTARLVHGEGVAIGMACAMRFSVRLGHAHPADAARVEQHLRAVGLPTRIHDIAGFTADVDAILAAMRQDKKVERGALTFILARGVGQCFIAKGVAEEEVRSFLTAELA